MTKTKKAKTIKVDLLPEDFEGNNFNDYDCPLARAIKRKLKRTIICGAWTVGINEFKIKRDGFLLDDYEFVKKQYEKDPKAKKVIYYVELIPINY